MRRSGCREVFGHPDQPGDFLIDPTKRDHIEILLARNLYGFSPIGLKDNDNTAGNKTLLHMAVTDYPGVRGVTLEAVATNILNFGAEDAVILDQGFTVFQRMKVESSKLVFSVQSSREQVRGVFIAVRPNTTA